MSVVKKEPAPLPASDDGARLEALLDVFCHLELDDQVRALASRVASWAGAEHAWTFVRGDDPRRLIVTARPAASSGDEGAVTTVDLAKIERYLAGKDELSGPGVPSFLTGPASADRKAGAVFWTLAVRDPGGSLAGAFSLGVRSDPDPGLKQRVLALLRDARPAVANGLAVRSIRELVFKDDTADCFNRRYFNEFLAEELSRATRFKASLSLIFFDMDNLKEVNSRLGHAMGSRAIFEVSQRVRAKIRRFDKLFRFGGDEFCIVLPETEWHGALEVAERVRESIAGKALLAEATGGAGVKMTASLGIASFPLHARSIEELIHLADWAMQRIKRGTKNSIAIAEIAKPEPS